MYEIGLEAIPNQTFSVTINEHDYDFEIVTANACIAVTIVRDGITVIEGVRAICNYPLIPYSYLEDGNFILYSNEDGLPDYEAFGVTQGLIFLTLTELAEIRAGL